MKSNQKPEPEQPEPAYVMESDDQFYAIIVSSPIRYEVEPDAETILTFFVIRRQSGTIDIFNIMKTFQNDKCISRKVQSKLGISESKITAELEAIKTHFTEGVREKTNFTISWNELDLSSVIGRYAQMRRIHAWDGLRVWTQPDFSLN